MDKQDILEKAMTLMAEALKQYEEGKFDLAEHSREQANHFFDEAKAELSTEEGIEKAMYGECRNFGIIYNVIEENADKLYETKEGRKAIGKVINYIKSNDILLHEFRVFNAFTNPVDIKDVENYVNEAISVVNRYGKKKLSEENSKLVKLIKELNINENVEISDDAMDLYEAVEYVLLNEPSISNVKKYSEVKGIIRESIERNNKVSSKKIDMDEIRDNGVKELTEKYNNDLNDDEKRLVEEISGSPKKAEKRFNKIKNSLLSQLQEKINESEGVDKDGWQHIYETVNGKTFEKNTVLNTIADMISLKETIE